MLPFSTGMEPRREAPDSRPDSPQSDDSSSESDLSSPSLNRDSDFDFANRAKDAIEAEPNRNTILAMAPIEGSFENESDTNSTATTKTLLPSPKDTSPAETEKRIRAQSKPVRQNVSTEFCPFNQLEFY